jgi:cytochrome c oxidase assembly protein subunit 20
VGGFITSSVASYEYCTYRRKLEKEGMRRAAQIIEAKKAEKLAAATERKAAKEAATAAKETEAQTASKGSSWKFW